MLTLEIPQRLQGRPFRRGEALAAGLTRTALAGKRFRQLFRGVYVDARSTMTWECWVRAALLVLPSDAAISHLTAFRALGIEVGPAWPLHFSTNSELKTRHPGLRLHRRRGPIERRVVDGLPSTGPDRTFVDSATVLGFVQLVQAGDELLHRGCTTVGVLAAYLERCHLHGVVRARRVFALVRERSESPMETLVRLMIVFARLPEPDTNRLIHDDAGRFVARGDLPYYRYKVLVEYDGEWHERSRAQRRRDRDRRAALERLGWIVVVILVEDLTDKQGIVRSVEAALRRRGYDGPPAHFNVMWTRWFA